MRQAFDDLVDSAQASRFLDICAARVGVSDAHISFQGVVEEVNVLEHEGELCHEVGGVPVAHVCVTHSNASRVHVVEACDEARDGGFTTARGTDDRRHGSGFDAEGYALQDRVVGLVGEGHVLEGHGCA